VRRATVLQSAFAALALFGGLLAAVALAEYRERGLPIGVTNWGPGGVTVYAYGTPWWATPAAVVVALIGLTAAVWMYRRQAR
jgi:hypothetical protein